MRGIGIRALGLGIGIIGSALAPVAAETVDFEASAYAAGKTFLGADQWAAATAVSTSQPPAGAAADFLIQSGETGKWAHILASESASAFRPFPSLNGSLDLRWKWRGQGESVRACLGAAGIALATGGTTTTQVDRAIACLEPGGAISAGSIRSAETWQSGIWYYMRLALDVGAGKFTLYLSEDSLRALERVAIPATVMAGSGSLSRLVLETGSGGGAADVDDIAWESVSQWHGGTGPDSNWTTAANWSGNVVPDAMTQVVFTTGSGCIVDKNVSVSSITVAPAYKGTLALGQQILSVGGNADFTGGTYASGETGRIRFAATRGQSLTGPVLGKALPALVHEGPGLLRLDGRVLYAAAFTQSQGEFDFNGYDVVASGGFTVKNGRPGTFRNLDGRAISVGKSARLEGISKDTLLGLATSPKGWILSGSGTDSLVARFATLGNARATANPAYAFQSADAGGNTGWSFPGAAAPGLPVAAPAGGFFSDSIVVRLSAPTAKEAAIFYLLGGKGPFRYQDSLVLRESATLKAVSVYGTQTSDTAQWDFKRGQAAPFATPGGRSFADTLRVTLAAKGGNPAIHYTLDGSLPTAASARYPGAGLLLDSSVVITAIAVGSGEPSTVLSETYTLIPGIPAASPRGGDFSSFVEIQLSAKAARATIFYTLDGTTPGPERGLPPYGDPIRLDTSAVLKVVAVTGRGSGLQRSPILTETYAFIRPGARTLSAGQRIDISGNYSIASPMAGAGPVQMEVIAADSMKSLPGFRDIQFGIRVSLPKGATAFPKVVFNAPLGETRALYSVNANASVHWITSADTCELPWPGTYFLGTDTLPPAISYSGETFTTGDSTRLVVSIQDNVANLSLDVDRSDDPTAGFQAHEITNAMVLMVPMKSAPGSLAPLTIRLRVDDHSLKSAFPPDGTRYALAQRFTSPIRTPTSFRIGSNPADLWDLIALPLAADPPITLAQLRKNNDVPELEGVSLEPATGKYRYLGDAEPLLPGSGVWIAARASLPSLVFPALQTSGHRGSGNYRLSLRPGWNLVANPTLSTMYWPVTRTIPEAYDASLLKGLFAWDAQAGNYTHAESLEPWRGYFAFYKGARDTLVDLRSLPVTPSPAAPGAKASAAATGTDPTASPAGYAIRLSLGSGPTLRLGASPTARDGIGVEDDPQPMSPSDKGPKLFALRGGKRFASDIVAWKRGGLVAWKLVAGLSASAADSARVESLSLPEGYAAWAWSRNRGLRFPLTQGSSIPMYPGFTDSLDILAGPAAELSGRLAEIPTRVDAFSARASAQPGRYLLDLRLPRTARVRLSLWSMDGRARATESLDLPEGIYHLVRDGGGRFPPGMYILSLECMGGGMPALPRRLSLKIAMP